MIWFLRVVFSLIVVTMIAVSTWASLDTALWLIPKSVIGHRWFIATLYDTYFAFLTFYVWVAYKEKSIASRILWFFLIMILGNIAIGSYMAIQLWRVPANASVGDILLRKP